MGVDSDQLWFELQAMRRRANCDHDWDTLFANDVPVVQICPYCGAKREPIED